jgi:hypothetical protein
MTQRGVVRPLLLAVAGLIGFTSVKSGFRLLFAIVTGELSRRNYPGIALVAFSMAALLPVVLFSIWREQLGYKLLVWVGVAGCIGELTTPCGWEPANRAQILLGAILFSIIVLVALGLKRNAKQRSSWRHI